VNERQEAVRNTALDVLVIGWDTFMNQQEKLQFLVANAQLLNAFCKLFTARHCHHRSASLAALLGLSIDHLEATKGALTAMLSSSESLPLVSAVLHSLVVTSTDAFQLFTAAAAHIISLATTIFGNSKSVQDLEKNKAYDVLLRSLIDLLSHVTAENSAAVLSLLRPLIQLVQKVDSVNQKLFPAAADDVDVLLRSTQVQTPLQEVKESSHPSQPETDSVDIVAFPK
jgi:hypothetical protein